MQVSVEVVFDIFFTQDSAGWWTATSKYGSTTAQTKEECVRILKDRVKG